MLFGILKGINITKLIIWFRKLLHCNWLRVSLIVNLKAVEIEVHKLI